MKKAVLEVSHLTKEFRTKAGIFKAVDDISFDIKEGEIVGLLGPNGAGKTTTIQMLLDMITPTSGSIKYFGRQFPKFRESLAQIGFGSAYSHLQSRLTIRQNLIIYAGLYGLTKPEHRIRELLQLFGIENLSEDIYWKLSAGQQTRVNLVKALLHKPKLLLLDEPTASLDPEIAHVVVDLIQKLRKKEHVSILFTSHNMREVERLCDRVVFLHTGKILTIDTPLGLTKRIGAAVLTITFDATAKKVATELASLKLKPTFLKDHVVTMDIKEAEIPKVLFKLGNEGVWITDISIEKPNLEDVFLSIAKGDMHELAKN
jgi:ABC-2 type transport system ATP-binding protein